jgi:hypothetical protein
MALALAAMAAATCALVLAIMGLPLAWPVILWAALCGFIAGGIAGAPWK